MSNKIGPFGHKKFRYRVRTIKEHLWGILNAIILKASNGASESINSRIKMLKIRSRGFRNKARYRSTIYFHLGGLQLYPEVDTR